MQKLVDVAEEEDKEGLGLGYRSNGVPVSVPADPIKFFIKDEPHKKNKVDEGRFRLIQSFSLEDQLVDKCLFYPWFGAEVVSPMIAPSKAGWSPLPGGYQRLMASFPDKAVAIDKTAWDWTMPAWVIFMYVWLKLSQCRNCTDEYMWMCWRRAYFVWGPGSTYRMHDGVVLRQLFWGVQKTGCLLTLSLNSQAQDFQHCLAWIRAFPKIARIPKLWCMGDDQLMEWFDDIANYMAQLSKTGCIVKKEELNKEFAGFEFLDKDSVRPLYPVKHQFVLRHVEPENEQQVLLAFSLLYALAGSSWFDAVVPFCDFPVGPVQRCWAKGLMDLQLLIDLPGWCIY